MNRDVDLVIVGSGFAGSLTAMIARRLGWSVLLVERGRHPRFVIGESSTPLADLLWAGLAARYGLPALAPFARYGSWRRAHPDIACGLKRGFTFVHHRWGEAFTDTSEHVRLMLVAASRGEADADTHWYRPDFDAFLVQEAQRLGVDYVDDTRLEHVSFAGRTAELTGRAGDRPLSTRARLVVDASGPRGFLFHALRLRERPLPHFPATQALYTHFADVDRFEHQVSALTAGAALPPFPLDDAALHHVFPGGWVWVLRFSNGLTSAGVVAEDTVAGGLGLAEGAAGWERLLARLPSVAAQVRNARRTRPLVHVPRLPFWCGPASGANWIQLPYATGFLDPLLSTGFPMTLLGIERLARVLERGVNSFRLSDDLASCAAAAEADFLAAERLVSALYAGLGDPEAFNALLLLYFAAASFSEVASREGRGGAGFLLRDHPVFGPASARCCLQFLQETRAARAVPGSDRAAWLAGVHAALEPVNLMGLGNLDRKNWYPVP
jgi:FADH2 O2-dependent halogenase